MSTTHAVDLAQAHRHFAVDCFNRAWELIEKPNRSQHDDEQMLLLALASLWHWTQRADCTDQNLSVGHWQVSRVYAVLQNPQCATAHGERSLQLSAAAPPFYQAYAHEALARAAMIAGDQQRLDTHLAAARGLAATIADPAERSALESDLATLLASSGTH